MIRRDELSLSSKTLPLSGLRAYLSQIILIASAVLLPYAAHTLGLPVRYLLPMHWPIILAGLVFGWRGGAISGLFAPMVNFLITGYPQPHILFPMTVELIVYGAIAGIFYEKLGWNSFFSVTFALFAGRIVFILAVIITNVAQGELLQYLYVALLPGLYAAVAQIIALPLIGKWWVNREISNGGGRT